MRGLLKKARKESRYSKKRAEQGARAAFAPNSRDYFRWLKGKL
jgi:hypothetical protein